MNVWEPDDPERRMPWALIAFAALGAAVVVAWVVA